MSEIFIPDIKARKSLAKKLGLDFNEFMQDWEYEISDYKRLNDFESEYRKEETSREEKESLMEIMLDCLNDILEDNQKKLFDEVSVSILSLLKANQELHKGTFNYWTKNSFLISDKIVKII